MVCKINIGAQIGKNANIRIAIISLLAWSIIEGLFVLCPAGYNLVNVVAVVVVVSSTNLDPDSIGLQKVSKNFFQLNILWLLQIYYVFSL